MTQPVRSKIPFKIFSFCTTITNVYVSGVQKIYNLNFKLKFSDFVSGSQEWESVRCISYIVNKFLWSFFVEFFIFRASIAWVRKGMYQERRRAFWTIDVPLKYVLWKSVTILLLILLKLSTPYVFEKLFYYFNNLGS